MKKKIAIFGLLAIGIASAVFAIAGPAARDILTYTDVWCRTLKVAGDGTVTSRMKWSSVQVDSGNTTASLSLTGVLSTDQVQATSRTAGNRVVCAVPTAGAVIVTANANAGGATDANTQISVLTYR